MYLGIDFGTSTNYIVKVDLENETIEPISNIGEFGGGDIVDNAIYYADNNVLIGKPAINRSISDPKNLVRYIKLKLGQENTEIFIPRKNRNVSPTEIASDIFKKTIERVKEISANESIDGVVVTVPFDYMHKERKAIKKAAELAGLKVLGLIEEPLAAAISTSLQNDTDGVEIVFDLGGGTLDITVAKVSENDGKINIETLNTAGSKVIGGRYIDKAIFDYIYETELNREISTIETNELLEVIRERKENLTDEDELEIDYDFKNGDYIETEFSEEILEDILEKNGILDEIKGILIGAIEDAAVKKESVNRVLFVGGATKLNIIKKSVKNILGDKVQYSNFKEQKLVGEGAGYYLIDLIKENKKYNVIPKLNHSIGIDEQGKIERVINKNFDYDRESDIKEYLIEKTKEDVCLDIYQGESNKAKNCERVGQVRIESKRINGKVGISFIIDRNGIIKYKLYDLNTGKRFIEEKELN